MTCTLIEACSQRDLHRSNLDRAMAINDTAQALPPKVVRIADLFPTQVTVGMREVYFKRKRWREKNGDEAANYLNTHRIPVILGPDTHYYIIDRHHLVLALYDEGISEVLVSIVANMSGLSFDEFWTTLESRNWTHPFDDEGSRLLNTTASSKRMLGAVEAAHAGTSWTRNLLALRHRIVFSIAGGEGGTLRAARLSRKSQ